MLDTRKFKHAGFFKLTAPGKYEQIVDGHPDSTILYELVNKIYLSSTEDKYAFVLKLCAHISGCTVEQVDAQIVKVMSESKWEDL